MLQTIVMFYELTYLKQFLRKSYYMVRKVEMPTYDEKWPSMFKKEADTLCRAFGDQLVACF